MPTTSLDDSGDWANWLQNFVQNQGALGPYGVGAPGAPGGPPASPPPWGVYGGHSMNYGPPAPATGQTQGAGSGRPSVAPGTQQPSPTGWSVTNALNALNPISSAEAAPLNMGGGDTGNRPVFQLNPTPSAVVTGSGDQPPPTPRFDPKVADAGPPPFRQPDHPSTMRYPMWPTPPAATAAPVPGPLAMPARPVTPTPATAYRPASSPAATSTAAPQSANNPFGMIDRTNAAATQGQPGRGMQTALNLAGLFGGGQPAAAQPAAAAVNPRGVIPASATASVPNSASNAPWWMGPFQQGVFGPSAADLAAARARSGYQ